MSDEGDALLDENKDQDEIRAELSKMSFEDLQKLKERLGTKVYNEAVFGVRKVKKTDFKRENKNRPREMSSKKPVPRFREIIQTKKLVARDPRFDSLCGTFDEKKFQRRYSFLTEVKQNDLKRLKQELENTTDPKRLKKVKYLIQRLENQLREENRKKAKEQKQSEEKKEIEEAIKRGERPVFKKKSEKKLLDLVSQYEELKNTGKLKKHIQRLRKKTVKKDKQRLAAVETD